ncbi:MAG TPA: molybdopterin cofactor-binding domain-containing protein [Blastocatellia bacterium]|nr:molybdopterin cofactor-binding domain-containing protein [Blastocatellia bacterium]
MSDEFKYPDAVEPERYELFAAPAYHFNLDRRDFFKLFGGGIVVGFMLKDALALQESGGRAAGESGRAQSSRQLPREIGAWLQIGEDGAITVYTGKVEFGQDIRTSLAQVVAEELRVPLASINLVMGDTDLTPYDMGTFGSRTTPTMGPQLRKASAAAREVLIDLAAEALKADRASLAAVDGKVVNSQTKQAISYARLAKGQKLLKQISDEAPTTPASQWNIAGTSAPKVDGRDFVTGKHKYTSDMKRPGMLYGKVVRPASFDAALVSADTREAEALAGVTVVKDGDFIGVAATDPQLAARAASLVKAEWKSPAQPSNRELFDYLKNHPAQRGRGFEGNSGNNRGSISEGLSAAHKKLQQSYTVAYIAHTPMEPRAAVAEWKDGKLTVWTGTQRPFGVRSELAEAFRIPEERVRVIVPDTGSGYGGKHTGEAALESARISKATGKPVKVVWTREEEFTWAYFRPAGVIEITSGVLADGTITAWEYHNYNSGPSGIQPKYEIANQKIEFHPTEYPLRQGSYRGLAATANHFARETHMDELAHSLKMDPLEFRLKNIKDSRLRAVLEAAAKSFGWAAAKSSPERGYGIACGFEKGGYIATCAEVAIDRPTGKVKIARVVEAFECGAIVNPDHLKNQIEGAIVMAIGGALFESVEFENGRILNARLSRYRVPRFGDVPAIEVVMVDRKDLPSAGAGETPIVGLAPAVGNAIFNATGVRLRALPMAPNGLTAEPDRKAR